MKTLSVVILTHNEEKNIIDCIESVEFCDEIIVVDDDSTDRTLSLVHNLNNKKIHVIQRPLNSNFAAHRNFALEKARGDWILFIDADERVGDALQKEIKNVVENSDCDGYSILRRDSLWGRKLLHGETGNTYFVRLGKKDSGTWGGHVHEVWRIHGKVGKLTSELLHYPHPTIQEFLSEIDIYTTMRADELHQTKTVVLPRDIIMYPLGKFLVNYFFKRGYLDGTAGFVHAALMSLHSFMVRGKLFLMSSYDKK